MIRSLILLFISFFIVNITNAQTTSEVLLLSSLHKNHVTNLNYSYDSITQIIQRFKPDIFAVEIRPSDISRPKEYLARFYPLEMHDHLFKNDKITYHGFDWLGEEIGEAELSEKYFSEILPVIQLQKKMNADSVIKEKLKILDIISKEKFQIIKSATPQQMIDGKYDLINKIYYQQMAFLLKGTEYEGIYDFYERRDFNIAENIKNIIEKNPSKRILIIMGADHRSYTHDYLNKHIKDKIHWINQF